MSQEEHYIDKVNVGGTIYKIHDTDTRNNVNTLSNNVSAVNSSLNAINSSIVNLTNKVNTIENNSGSGSGGSHDTDDAKHITLKGTTQRIIVKTITNLHVTKQGYVTAAQMKVGDTADYADKPDDGWNYYKGSVKAGDVLKVAVYTIGGNYCYLTDNNNKVTQAFNSTIEYYTTDDLVNIKTINVDTNGTFVCCGVAKRGMAPYILKISTTGNTTTANVLVQSDMTSTDTIYIIKSNLDLNGETLTIPSGCTLKFDGGSISNGIIIGNKTKIDAKKGDNIFSNVRIWGTWNVSEAYSSWLSPTKNGYRIAEVGFKYVWVKFATDANGNGMQNSMFNSSKEVMPYMGIAEGKDVDIPSTKATDYKWYPIAVLSTKNGPEYTNKLDVGLSYNKYLWVVWQYANGLTLTDDNNVEHKYTMNDIAPKEGCTAIGIALQKDSADKTVRYANAYLKDNGNNTHTIKLPVNLDGAFYWITTKDEDHSIKYPYYRVEGTTRVVAGWYPMGAMPDGLTSYDLYYDADDTVALRQLLNLKADKTIIEEGEYFVNGDNHVVDGVDIKETDYLDGLTIRDVDSKELVINGYLKMIPVRLNSMYRVLQLNNCNHYKISGSGSLVGDVPEHFGDNGEWAYGLELMSCDYVTVSGITCSYNWGDGISCSNGSTQGATSPEEESKMFRQGKHIYEHVTTDYNRRTGFVYLTGNDIICRACDFNYNGVYRGCSTFSGVDIEPDFYTNGKYDYVSDVTFSNCNFKGNFNVGLRAEHCLNLSVYDCNFKDNGTAIAPRIIRSCTNAITGEVVTGNSNIYSNHFYNNIKLLEAEYHSRVNFYNNYVVNSVQCIVGEYEMSKIYNNIFIQPSLLLNLKPSNPSWMSDDVEVYNNKIMNLLGPISKGGESCLDIYIHDNTFTYNGGKDATHYLGGGTFDYPVIKSVPIDQQAVSQGVTFNNNIIDDEFYGNVNKSYTNTVVIGDKTVFSYNKMETKRTDKSIVFFKGDKVRTLDQEGIVVIGGRTDFDKNATVFKAGMTVKANQKVVDSQASPTKEFYCKNAGTLGDTFPTTTTSGNVTIEFITTSVPVIAWQTTGFLPSDANYPTTFNSKGRRLFKENGSVIVYNGSTFVEE